MQGELSAHLATGHRFADDAEVSSLQHIIFVPSHPLSGPVHTDNVVVSDRAAAFDTRRRTGAF